MNLTFGKYKGSTLEQVLLTNPAYISWMLGEDDVSGKLAAARAEAQKLVRIFDQKPFVEKCQSAECKKPATQGTVYGASIQLVCWCSECDPYKMGAFNGKLQVVSTFQDAIHHVAVHCDGRKGDYSRLIRNIAEAKGLKKRVTRDSALNFFR